MSYEYQSRALSFAGGGQEESEKELNTLGAEWWELVHVAPAFVWEPLGNCWACDRGLAILKRRLPESVISAR